MPETSLTACCTRCGDKLDSASHRVCCGYPLQPITDEELAGVRATYEAREAAALGYATVARLLNEIDRGRAEVERLRGVETKLRGHLDAIGVAHRESVTARRALDTMREAEQEADVRVVAALLEAQQDGASMDECKHAFAELRARFADRIEA